MDANATQVRTPLPPAPHPHPAPCPLPAPHPLMLHSCSSNGSTRIQVQGQMKVCLVYIKLKLGSKRVHTTEDQALVGSLLDETSPAPFSGMGFGREAPCTPGTDLLAVPAGPSRRAGVCGPAC